MTAMSSAVMPREVTAGVPRRTPPGVAAERSPKTAFLLAVIAACSKTFSIFEPVRSCGRRSQSTRWVSVPPVMSECPRAVSSSPSRLAFALTAVAYSRNSSVFTCLSAVAMPAMTLLCGPPWSEGNTAALIRSMCSALQKIMAPRGPRSDLCVVVVTMSAYSNGELRSCAATSPA
eukprot:Amastigsp_a3076_76.p3 type:complete len:175 gc:universal Amastigsp_a3076_76:1223-699(-)